MKTRIARLIILTCLVAVLATLGACQLIFPSTGELYVSIDGTYGSVTCELYLIERLSPGRSKDTGTNMFASRARTETIQGRSWMVFEVPKGRWDIYMEYYTHNAYRSYATERDTIGLDVNDWAALWISGDDWTSTRMYQGVGGVSLPSTL